MTQRRSDESQLTIISPSIVNKQWSKQNVDKLFYRKHSEELLLELFIQLSGVKLFEGV